MKRFADLTPNQQTRAVEESLRRLLNAITEGGLRFNDVANGNDLQDRIDRAARDSMGDVRLWSDLILDRCRRELTTIAGLAARDAIYAEGDTVISLDDL